LHPTGEPWIQRIIRLTRMIADRMAIGKRMDARGRKGRSTGA